MMDHHNFKDKVLFKRLRATPKKKMGEKLKYKNTQSNYRKLFSFTIKGCVFFQSFGVCKKMSVENTTKK